MSAGPLDARRLVPRMAEGGDHRDPLSEVADVAERARTAIIEALRPLATKKSHFKVEIVFNGLDVHAGALEVRRPQR